MSASKKESFSIQEANKMVPIFTKSFRRIYQMNACIQRLIAPLKQNKIDPHIDDLNILEAFDEPTVDAITSIKVLLSAIQNEVDRIHDAGAQVKSIEKGLISIPHQHLDRTVFLCWKVGDASINYWLEKNSKFHTRKPISDLQADAVSS